MLKAKHYVPCFLKTLQFKKKNLKNLNHLLKSFIVTRQIFLCTIVKTSLNMRVCFTEQKLFLFEGCCIFSPYYFYDSPICGTTSKKIGSSLP